jgi:predicted metal-binding membrane protein
MSRSSGASARSDLIATLVGRERALVWTGIAGLTVVAWLYLLSLSRAMGRVTPDDGMAGMPGMTPLLSPWTGTDVAFTVVMWAVMMVGMMLPAAAPVILLFAAVNRKRREQGGVAGVTGIFILGYLLVWGGFSLGAALAQWGLHAAALLSPMMRTTSPILGGALLIVAGVYQLTPLKEACLARCQSPLGWLMTEWREGPAGAFKMGLRHGAYCLGCCWVLMGLLFVTGVMNLLWVAAITVFVLLEKVTPAGVLIGRIASVAMIAAGVIMLGRAAPTIGMGGM